MKKNPILNTKFPCPPPFHHFKPTLTLSPKLPSLFTNSHTLLASHLTFPPLRVTTTRVNASTNSVSLEDELVIEASTIRYLPPALTLMHGLDALLNALFQFKRNPPPSSSALIRFQVAVPLSINALEWFSCQPESSGVFPQFYMSKQLEDSTSISNKTYGVFGLGAAVQSPSTSDNWNSFRRYLLVDVPNITVYGILDFNYHTESSSLKQDTGSCCFIIPQVELNECDGFCILSGTLVWSDSFLCSFEQALHSYETTLVQARNHVPAMLNPCFTNFMKSIQKFNIFEDENLKMFYMEAQDLGGYNNAPSVMEMVFPSS